ncbi:MAG: hypothetical protein PHF86_01995 [Candidatus Nanoarchaeia archaeon]|nr:hypothetical protein [Candidatus Nanoarchaeia archaeon]
MKIVKESINFERGLDPKESMNIGIKPKITDWLYNYFIVTSQATKQSYFKINDDLTIDIYGFFATSWKGNFPDYIQFNKIFTNKNNNGDFQIGAGNKMNTLRGCPKIVEGNFDCTKNNLKNLIGGPIIVEGTYYCGQNPLESLEGLAKEIGSGLSCNNKSGLTKKDIPKETKFSCYSDQISISYWGNW